MIMKKIIGYSFWLATDNGDTNEWWREERIVSPIYKDKEMVLKAIALVKRKLAADIKKRAMDYFEDQKEYEKDIDAFKNDVKRGILWGYRDLISDMNRVKIEPVYLYEEPTDNYEKFEIAG